MDKLRDVNSVCQQANAPNIRRLKLIDVLQVVKINYPYLYNNPAVLNYQLAQTSLVLKPATRLIKIDFLSGLATHEEVSEESPEGMGFINRVSISAKMDNPDNALAVELMLNRGFIGFMEDRNGRCKVLGTVKQPLRLSTSTLSIGANEKTLVWQTKTRYQSYFIPSIKDEDIVLGEFNDDFSDDFNI
jgi:hypothetical protein